MTQPLRSAILAGLLGPLALCGGAWAGGVAGATSPSRPAPGRRVVPGGGGRTSAGGPSALVRLLQRRLGLAADGILGPDTIGAVKRFQVAHQLTGDGVVGPETWAALGVRGRHRVLAADGPTPGQPVVRALAGASVAPPVPAGSPASARGVPARITRALAAADRIATLPYIWGGGHASWDAAGYDCSGSVSYVLHAALALAAPEDSAGFETYGAPGPGTWITIYARADHVFMTIGDRRFDTSGAAAAGTRWQPVRATAAGYVVRHPIGL